MNIFAKILDSSETAIKLNDTIDYTKEESPKKKQDGKGKIILDKI